MSMYMGWLNASGANQVVEPFSSIHLGDKMKRSMDAQTVGRTMTRMEGYVAAKGQLGYEISRAKGTGSS